MHVLTKIFVVLVALLSVMLVPLVVVYAKNEDSFKAKYRNAESLRAAAESNYNHQQITHASQVASLTNEIKSFQEQQGSLRAALSNKEGQIAALNGQLTVTQTLQAENTSTLQAINTQLEARQALIEQLVNESSSLRTASLETERRNAELEAAIREQDRELEVANAAVRALQEQVQRLSEAEAKAVQTIALYNQAYGEIGVRVGRGEAPPTLIDVQVIANVIDVQNVDGTILVEIDAGQRDGVKVGWVMTLGDGQGGLIGKLRITKVDVNRATGIAETYSGDPVITTAGHRAYAFPKN